MLLTIADKKLSLVVNSRHLWAERAETHSGEKRALMPT
jgi:hypothetical protein